MFIIQDTESDEEIIPGINGHLYLLKRNKRNQEYLEPLPFTVTQISQNTGFSDPNNIWYTANTNNHAFWIDSVEWNVCKPTNGIPDITDDKDDEDDIPPCPFNFSPCLII